MRAADNLGRVILSAQYRERVGRGARIGVIGRGVG